MKQSRTSGFDICCAESVWSMQVLSAALHDTTLSVRVSAASALANVADALQQQQHQVAAQMIPPLSNLAAGMASHSIDV